MSCVSLLGLPTNVSQVGPFDSALHDPGRDLILLILQGAGDDRRRDVLGGIDDLLFEKEAKRHALDMFFTPQSLFSCQSLPKKAQS